MAFRVFRWTREFEIISIIDIVFLLLIFGIAVSMLRAPLISKMEGVVPRKEKSIMNIEIGRAVTGDQFTVSTVKITLPLVSNNPPLLAFPEDGDLLSMPDNEFSEQPACTLIANSIQRYARILNEGNLQNDHMNEIYLTVTNDTKMRIINFIISECSNYGGVISWLDVREIEK